MGTKGERSDGIDEGLDGVVVTRTELSDVDGERGRLVLRGHEVERLALAVPFEDACALLWDGALPDDGARERWRARLGRARVDAAERIPSLGDALRATDAMEALRAGLAHLPSHGSLASRPDEADEADAATLVGAVAVFAAAWSRIAAGEAPVPPDPSRGHAEDFLRMVRGPAWRLGHVQGAERAALDAYLVTVIDHGMNASTFTARVVASTGSDMVSSIVAALGALKGPLHGGAPGPVLDMLDAIGTPDRAEAWLEGELAAGRRIMGMGHRIYRVRDPRAAVLERAIEALEQAGARSSRLAITRAVERAAERELRARHPDRPLHANVELYTAIVLDTIGLPRTLFSATFAVGRVGGWVAHVREQRRKKRIIRPASLYVGPPPAVVPA